MFKSILTKTLLSVACLLFITNQVQASVATAASTVTNIAMRAADNFNEITTKVVGKPGAAILVGLAALGSLMYGLDHLEQTIKHYLHVNHYENRPDWKKQPHEAVGIKATLGLLGALVCYGCYTRI